MLVLACAHSNISTSHCVPKQSDGTEGIQSPLIGSPCSLLQRHFYPSVAVLLFSPTMSTFVFLFYFTYFMKKKNKKKQILLCGRILNIKLIHTSKQIVEAKGLSATLSR